MLLQISVGRLGVITEVEMIIMPQDMVTREVINTEFSVFVKAMQTLQNEYNAALQGTGSKTVVEVLAEYEGTQVRRILASHPFLSLPTVLLFRAVKHIRLGPANELTRHLESKLGASHYLWRLYKLNAATFFQSLEYCVLIQYCHAHAPNLFK